MGTLVTGNTDAAADDGFAAPTPETSRITESLYDGGAAQTPAAVEGTNFYGFSTLVSAIDRRGAELWEKAGANEAARGRIRESFVSIAKATALPEQIVTTVAEGFIDNQLAEARPPEPADAAAQSLDEQIVRWNAESREALTSTYGAKDGEELLERTRKFVRAHPALAKVLQERGLGSRPDIVTGIAAHVFSAGFR